MRAATKALMVGDDKKLHAGMGRSEGLFSKRFTMPKYAHPCSWASFISAGNREPLGR
jgi:hypothetical protein